MGGNFCMAGAFLEASLRREGGETAVSAEGGRRDGGRISLHTIPTLVNLSTPMHRTRGRVARPPRHKRTSPAKTPKAARVGVHGYDLLAAEFGVRQSQCLAASAAASLDAVCVAVRHSPRLSTAAAASGKGSNLASSPRESIMGGIL